MDRKNFIKKAFVTGVAGAMAPALLSASSKSGNASTYDKMMKQIGFNHLPRQLAGLPNKEEKTMNTILHKAATRGHANHGWLDSHHSFSFANYYNPERMHFGVLRVLNDDIVAPGKGFGTHPHDNMEIISIPLQGDLQHKDSMGNVAVIKEGDVQVMSAGTGIFHSEYNKNNDREVKFLQIWLFPRHKNVEPRYDQISIRDIEKKNSLYQILSPDQNDQGVWIHQDAWFYLGNFDREVTQTYQLNKPGNGVYAFVLEGDVEIGGQQLSRRDGFGMWDTEEISLQTTAGSSVLMMEVPMTI